MATVTYPDNSLAVIGEGVELDDDTPPTMLVPTVQLPVYGVRPPDRKWWLDQFISELDNGQFTNSGRLGDGMKRDARILGALEQRNAGLFGAPLVLTPSSFQATKDPVTGKETPHPTAVEACDFVKSKWEQLYPRAELEKLNGYGVFQGVGIAEKCWDTTVKPWTFTIKARHPQFYLWLWNTGCYHLITLNRALVKVPRRSSQFITHTPYGYENAFLDARIRALVDPWMMSQWSQSDWANWCEVHGKPIRKAIVPQSASPDQERAYVNGIAKLGTNTVVKVRQDVDGNRYDVELLEAVANGWEGFQGMLAWCDKKKAEVICGQSASMDGQGGLNSQENPGNGVRQDIKESDNAKLCESLYAQGLRELCEYGFGSAEWAPRVSYEVKGPGDRDKAALADWRVGLALAQFKTAGAPINARTYMERANLPVLTEEEEAEAKKQAQAEAQQEAKDAGAETGGGFGADDEKSDDEKAD